MVSIHSRAGLHIPIWSHMADGDGIGRPLYQDTRFAFVATTKSSCVCQLCHAAVCTWYLGPDIVVQSLHYSEFHVRALNLPFSLCMQAVTQIHDRRLRPRW